MPRLLDLQSKLQDTNAAIAQLERALAHDPASKSLRVSMQSLQKRAHNLEADFHEAADLLGVDVCTYRLFTNGLQPKVTGVAKALLDFQRLFTVVYDALTNGPKSLARIDRDVVKQTEFDFAYTFSGSIGMVMTLPNERMLLIESDLDRAMSKVFEVARADTPDDIDRIADTLGAATIRSLYRWADDHVATGFGADIKWRRRDEVRASLMLQEPELRRLKGAIEVTPDTHQETVSVTGLLYAADLNRRTFRLKVPGGRIRGKFTGAITAEQKAILPQTYRAQLIKTTRMRYAMDQPEETYFLVSLESVEEAPATKTGARQPS
jgi:hypothetical protein